MAVPETQLIPPEQLAALIADHWKEHAPQMYAELQQSGQLESLARRLAQTTAQFDANLRQSGLDPLQAASWAMREHALNLP
jgi:hypothetical protein